jgi:hypothetical protein
MHENKKMKNMFGQIITCRFCVVWILFSNDYFTIPRELLDIEDTTPVSFKYFITNNAGPGGSRVHLYMKFKFRIK